MVPNTQFVFDSFWRGDCVRLEMFSALEALDMPPEVFAHILRWLDGDIFQLVTLELTCKLWRSYTLLYAKRVSFRSVAKRIAAPSVVELLSHHGGHAAEDAALHLRHLDLGHLHSLAPKHFEQILSQHGAGLRSLNLCNCEGVNARVIESIVSHCTTNLTKLDLTGCRKLTPDAFEPLFRSAELASSVKSLVVRGCYRADSDAFGERLAESMTSLEHLDLRGFGQATNKLLLNVASKLTRLRHLEIQQYASPLDRDFIVSLLSNCKQLEFLNAKQCRGTWNLAPDPTVKQFNPVASRTLKVLELQHFSVMDDDSLRNICNATRESLQELSVSDCPTLTDDGLSCVASLPHLRRLECKNLLQVSDHPFVEIVTSCHLLEILNVEGCALITDSLTKAICSSPSGSCRNKITVNYSQCPLISDVSVLLIAEHCVKIRNVGLISCPLISTEAVLELLQSRSATLMNLGVLDCQNIDSEKVIHKIEVLTPQISKISISPPLVLDSTTNRLFQSGIVTFGPLFKGPQPQQTESGGASPIPLSQ